MSTPIPPSLPPSSSTPITPFSGGTANGGAPVDFFAPSIAQSLSAPPIDASNPRLSLSEFYGSISNANLQQKLREFLDAMNDPLFRQKLMKFAAQQAAYMSEIITLVYRYDSLQQQLEKLDLPAKASAVNSALNAYGSTTNDNAQINTINAASNAYNAALTGYQAALNAYQAALNTFEAAQTTYNNALAIWNSALADYQNGDISQAQLEAARSIFQSAENQFENADKPAFNSAKSTFDSAVSSFQSAESTYNTALNSYNAYVASRQSAINNINTAINSWNTTIANASTIIAKMNAIRSELGLGGLSSTSTISLVSGLASLPTPFGIVLRNSVQGDVDDSNGLSGNINTVIGVIGGQVVVINGNGYTPALTTPGLQGTIPSIPNINSDSFAEILGLISIPSSIVITTPAEQDLIIDYLLPRLSILEALKETTTKEDLFRADTENSLNRDVSGKFVINAGGGTSGIGVTNALGIASSPFLSSVLSKQAFEGFFNIFGVPAGSALVDQIGALYVRSKMAAGISSAGPAQNILANAALTGTNGSNAVNLAIALGNVTASSEIASSNELLTAIRGLIETDPTLAKLTPEQKNGLLEGIAGEIGASMNKAALNELARALGLPGLMPQILAKLAGITEKDPLASFNSQLRTVLFIQELAKILQISEEAATGLLETALKNQAKSFLAIQDSIIEQLSTSGIAIDQARADVERAAIIAQSQVDAEQQKAEITKANVLKESLLKSLAILEFDPAKADLIAAQTPLSSVNNLLQILINKGLTLPEANQVTQNALNALNLQDAIANPLSSFLIERLGSTTELAGLLRNQITNILSPAVGMRTALEVAENYGSLIFTRANSVTELLTVNERRLDTISYLIYDARLYENYREATLSYKSPELAEDSPLKLGKTLLLTGIPGGIANQGLTSQDNTLGPSANQSKHATSYPGIFG